jgi:DNA-binding MarR family transcriptional regulator
MILEMEAFMRGLLSKRALILVLGFITAASAGSPAKDKDNHNGAEGEPQEISFSLIQLPENPKQYTLAISDPDERNLSGSFSVDQLQILRAIMIEAEKFAMTAEAVGAKQPITTRFMDKQERAFIVDVQKDANQTRLFFTLKTEIGRLTWEAGRINRNTRREDGFFFSLLSRLEEALPKQRGQSPK